MTRTHLEYSGVKVFRQNADFDIESNTAEALKDKSKLLEKISAERITAEISKLFESPYPKRLGKILSDFKDVFSLVIPEIENSGNYDEICLKTSLVPPENNLRMIYFLCAVGYAHTENDRLRFSKVFTKRLGGISEILGKYGESDEAGSAFCACLTRKCLYTVTDMSFALTPRALLSTHPEALGCLTV